MQVSDIKHDIASNNEFIISFVGKRNLTVVCRAASNLIAEGYKIKLLFIGKTNAPSGVDEKYIYRTGVLPIEQLSNYVAIADCMVMPENMDSGCSFKSGSLAAALSMGVPVITNKGYLTEESLVHHKNIVFVNPDKEDDYCEAIKELMQNKALKNGISIGAKSIGELLTWTRTYEEYMKILQNHK